MNNDDIEEKLNKIIVTQNENNVLLKKIYNIVSKQSDLKDFGINIAADLFGTIIKGNI